MMHDVIDEHAVNEVVAELAKDVNRLDHKIAELDNVARKIHDALESFRVRKDDIEKHIQVKVNVGGLITDAIQKGLDFGYCQARDHNCQNDKNALLQYQFDAVFDELFEYITVS